MIISHLKNALNRGYSAQKCSICQAQFTLMLRIHKCKRCERFVCYLCGKHNEPIIQPDGQLSSTVHRICVMCMEDIVSMKNAIISVERYEMGQNKQFSKIMGFKYVQIQKCRKHQDYNYENFIKLYYQNQQHYAESAELIQKDVLLGRTDFKVFNYSMREFFYKLQKDKTTDAVRRNIANVLYALTTKFPDIGYCQGMSSIAAFLLAFASEAEAFEIFCDLLQNILPLNLYKNSQSGTSLIGLLAETHFIKKYFTYFVEIIKKQKLEDEGRDRLLVILDLICSKCILTLFITNMNFQNLMFFWEQLKTERSVAVINKAMIAIMYLFHESLQQNQTHYKFVERYIETMDPANFKEIYRQINIDLEERKQIVDQFYKQVSLEWNKETKSSTSKLSQISKFTKQEIQIIRKNFVVALSSPESLGMSLDQWLKFCKKMCNKQKYSKTLTLVKDFNRNYYESIFHTFDQENNNIMDFRQFICGTSILLRGTLKQKIYLYAQTLQNQVKCISQTDFSKLIKMTVSLIHSLFEKDQHIVVLEQRFKEKVNVYFAERQNVLLSEFNILMNDDYINTASIRTMEDKDDIFQSLIDSLKEAAKE